MTNAKSRIIPAVVAGALGVGSTAAYAAEPGAQELQQQIEALQAKVAQLESAQQSQAASDVDATVASVLKDAEKRSQLLQVDPTLSAGYQQGKFFLASSDGNFYLNPGLQLQVRYVANWSEDSDGDDQLEDGFEIRRAKFSAVGHAYTPDLTYAFQWESARNGGGVTLQDALIKYQFADNMAVKLGQFKSIPFHEENVSSKRQLTADRSLMNELLGGGMTDYVQGVSLIYDVDDNLSVELALVDGPNTDNTNFADNGVDWGIEGRGEYLVMGNSKNYADFTAVGTKDELLVVGAGFDYSQSGSDNTFFHTLDAQYENPNGLGVYGAWTGVMSEFDPLANGEDDSYSWGLLVQAGYQLDENWEIFGRWDLTMLDEDVLAAGAEDTINEFTFGANYYFEGHNVKATFDVTYLPDGSPSSQSGLGILASDEDEFVVRGQFQLLL